MVVQNHHGHPVGSCGSKSTEMRPCTTTFLHTAPKGRAQIAAGASALLCPPAAVIDTSYMDGKLAPRNKVKVVGGFCNKVRKDIFKYGCSCTMGGRTNIGQILDKCPIFVQGLYKVCPRFVHVQVLSKVCQI